MKKTRRLVTLSVIVAIAMVLSYVERLIPFFEAIPGVKAGLANIAIIFTLYKLNARDAVIVSCVRVVLASVLFGTLVSFLYSFFGAMVSLCLMILLKHLSRLSAISVSVVGGVMHNMAQIAVACVLLETNVITYYLPFLLLSGTLAGIVVGIAGSLLIKKVKI